MAHIRFFPVNNLSKQQITNHFELIDSGLINLINFSGYDKEAQNNVGVLSICINDGIEMHWQCLASSLFDRVLYLQIHEALYLSSLLKVCCKNFGGDEPTVIEIETISLAAKYREVEFLYDTLKLNDDQVCLSNKYTYIMIDRERSELIISLSIGTWHSFLHLTKTEALIVAETLKSFANQLSVNHEKQS
jgi:hypothetical protein